MHIHCVFVDTNVVSHKILELGRFSEKRVSESSAMS